MDDPFPVCGAFLLSQRLWTAIIGSLVKKQIPIGD